ncbi:MAG: ribose-5-phosphate isomerase A [Gemmatimonadales bacterium]
MIIVVDETKLSPVLGTRRMLPVEVVPFGWRTQIVFVQKLVPDAPVSLRAAPGGAPFVTDHGNFILDCTLGPLEQPQQLAPELQARAGVVAHGLFLGLATDVIVAGRSGVDHRMRR